ncbi:RNA polymerase II transcription factor B subunit 4 [Elsinoe australis]|uniref:General transcription and DNA repair factor IIH subunit TFB4 n=1 Tax=Elsinoe australis TaxID=40998 RepID=A0A4U7B3B3_9PEZI|nr:RNA polymerase II transcription factor B subunit 4 [Elsinoe australis]
MNAVDATDRETQSENGVPASLLTIILDTNPHAWALLANELPLSKIIANLLVFINAHIAINNANKVAIIASHTQRARWLYPSPSPEKSSTNGHDISMPDAPSEPREDPNKYRPFAQIEHTLTSNLRDLISTTPPSDLENTPSTMVAGALTMALSYISKTALTAPTTTSSTTFNPSTGAGSFTNPDATTSSSGATTQGLTSRILILSVSGDLSSQYIPMMNAIFAAQRMRCPIDILKLAGDTVFLQQAADATGGIYLNLAPESSQSSNPTTSGAKTSSRAAGILQYLLQSFLPDPSARLHLYLPGQTTAVDFRAACFCHRRIVDIGFVCSICLSIFCEPLGDDGRCLTCGTDLGMGDYGRKPVVVRRKKKKRGLGGGEGREETPGSVGGTPGPG